MDSATEVHQLSVAEDSIEKTTFRPPDVFFYEWLVMPLGLTNAPAYFVEKGVQGVPK